MKHIKKFGDSVNEGITVSDWRDHLSGVSKNMHRFKSKEFYIVVGGFGDRKSVTKLSIPEEYRGEFEEEYTGGDYGHFFKDTAEFIEMIANDYEASTIIMDYEIDDFIKSLQRAKSSEPEEY